MVSSSCELTSCHVIPNRVIPSFLYGSPKSPGMIALAQLGSHDHRKASHKGWEWGGYKKFSGQASAMNLFQDVEHRGGEGSTGL